VDAAIARSFHGSGRHSAPQLPDTGHGAGIAAVAQALRPDDIAFLHYRDAAFQIARAGQVPCQQITWNMLLSFACSSKDPISGGGIRHWAQSRRTV